MIGAAEPSQIDNAANASSSCGLGKVLCREPILSLKVAISTHGMNEVKGRIDPCQRTGQRLAIQYVTRNDFRRIGNTTEQRFRSARKATDVIASLLQKRQHSTTNVAGCAGKQDNLVRLVFH